GRMSSIALAMGSGIPLENMVFALFFYFSSEDYYTTLNSITYTGTILLIFLLIIFGFTLLLE
ncbi:hypothetical protein, partial [Proteus mirabilis]|uniref:hypothetical protein n=1 Tax=Proteus mirabilis TaxID=584 RepID=UPI0019535F71